MSCFCAGWGTVSCVLLCLSSAVYGRQGAGGTERGEERREEDRQREKISIRLAASVPFSLSGAGNLHFV